MTLPYFPASTLSSTQFQNIFNFFSSLRVVFGVCCLDCDVVRRRRPLAVAWRNQRIRAERCVKQTITFNNTTHARTEPTAPEHVTPLNCTTMLQLKVVLLKKWRFWRTFFGRKFKKLKSGMTKNDEKMRYYMLEWNYERKALHFVLNFWDQLATIGSHKHFLTPSARKLDEFCVRCRFRGYISAVWVTQCDS